MHLLILPAGIGIATASAALLLQGRRALPQRCFAVLISITVTLILFSIIAWAATRIVAIAPLALTWGWVGTLAVFFALRLYRELQPPPSTNQ
jgi:hypothetical protein